jgi:2'-hydroxyisoflavone reductase
MNVLVLGGSSFVGRAIVWSLYERGYDVTVFNRGVTPTDLPAPITRLVGDRRSDLSALSGLSFDVTIDASAYQRRDVELFYEALGDRAGYYQQISTISAYEVPTSPGADESTPLRELGEIDPNAPVTGVTYGPLKAECERAARELFGDSVGVLRPTYIIGAHDHTLRFHYWVARLQRGGRVAFPGPRTHPLQWIDARDLGEFATRLAEERFAGAVHVLQSSPPLSFGEVLERIATHVAPSGTTLVEIDPERLSDPSWRQKFPLWTGALPDNALTFSNARALSLGLTLRSLEESVDDTAAWFGSREWPAQWLVNDGDLLAE